MKVGEPSHSDKDFCIAFRKQQGTGTTGTGTTGTTTGNGTTTKPATTPATTTTKPTTIKDDYEYKQGTHNYRPTATASTGSLPFTGLELWQVALMGALLIGGGLTARRLLTR
jgi:hypothetical protein